MVGKSNLEFVLFPLVLQQRLHKKWKSRGCFGIWGSSKYDAEANKPESKRDNFSAFVTEDRTSMEKVNETIIS